PGELGSKKLELLHEAVPGVKKIAVLVNPNNRLATEADIRSAQAAAPRLGLEVIVVNVGTGKEIQRAFATAVQQGAGAVCVGADLVRAARASQLPHSPCAISCPRCRCGAKLSAPVS